MSNGEYIIETVKIMMVTNIPNKEPIPFTSDVLYHPFLQPNLGKYKLKKYPSVVTEGLLYDTTLLNQLDYSRRVRFFFEPDYMRKKLAELNRNGGMTVNIAKPIIGKAPNEPKFNPSDEEWDDYEKQWDEYRNINDKKQADYSKEIDNIKIKNIEVMIKMLFQTKYPIIENVSNSYCLHIEPDNTLCNSIGFTAKGSVPPFIIALAPGLFKGLESYYSYIKTDGSVYTVTKTIWLNDVINNPYYRGLIDQFNTFKTWRNNEIEKIKKIYIKQSTTLQRVTNEAFSVVTLALLKNLSEQANTLNTRNRRDDFTNKQLVNYIVDFIAILFESSKDDKSMKTLYKKCNNSASLELYNNLKIDNAYYDDLKNNGFNLSEINHLIREKSEDFKTNLTEKIDKYVEEFSKLPKYEVYKFIANEKIDINGRIDIVITPTNVTNLRSIYNDLIKNGISIRENIKKKLNPVFDQAKRVDNLDTINTKYFGKDININFEDDDESTRNLLKTNYGQYVKFVDNLKKFITPNKESNNIQLQSLIEDYVEGNTDNIFTNVITAISKNCLGKHNRRELGKDITKYMKVDYTTTETITEGEPKTELYLAVDVVKGELTDSNIRKITCNYRGEELTDRFDRIRKKWAYNPFEIDKKRLFFDFEKILAAKEPVKKGKGEAGPLPPPPPPQKGGPPGIAAAPPPPPAILAQGGKKYTRNKKVGRMRNHHITQRMRR